MNAARERAILAALLLLALALRLANGAFGSLWLDDFHSLYHARAADLGTFFAVLGQDNHPPLHLLLVRASRALLGEAPWALRLPALLAGLATLGFVWRIGARLACPAARSAATLLLALSSLHVESSSEVRMYALLGLASAGLLDALLTRLEDGHGAWRITLWTTVGLHAHYHFIYVLVALVAGTLILMARDARARSALRTCLLAFACAGLLALPWYLLVFPHQLDHGLPPGGSDATPLRLLEGFKNLVFLNVSVGPEWLRLLGLGASVAMLALALTGIAGLLRPSPPQPPSPRGPTLALLLGCAAFGAPLLSWLAAQVSQRAGFEWRYMSGALPAFVLVLGAEACAVGAFARLRRGALLVVVLVALPISIGNASDGGEEGYRDAVACILERAGPEDAVLAADWQPALFPHALGWSYYAERTAPAGARPELLEHTQGYALVAPERLAGKRRVYCCLRSLPGQCALLRQLRAAFPNEETRVFGRSVFVHVFTRP